MDKLKAFETFASVAGRGSLSAAARAEGVAPAVIGRRLDALEEHLGIKLLVRTTRRISLTHEGSAFLEDCQRILADLAKHITRAVSDALARDDDSRQAFAPMLAILSAQHETQYSRLFRS